MFHQRNGLFFERQASGAVRVRVIETADAREPYADKYADNVVFEQVVEQGEFASVVAAMTPRGESARTYAAALALLRGYGLVPEAVVEKRKEGDEKG